MSPIVIQCEPVAQPSRFERRQAFRNAQASVVPDLRRLPGFRLLKPLENRSARHEREATLLDVHRGPLAGNHISDELHARGRAAGGGPVLRHAGRSVAPAAGREDSGRGGPCLHLLPNSPVGQVVRDAKFGDIPFGGPVAGASSNLLGTHARRAVAPDPFPVEVAVPSRLAPFEAPDDLGKPFAASECIVRRGHADHPPFLHIGTFEGFGKANSHGGAEDYGLIQALLSLIAVALFMLAVAAFAGAL